MRLINVSAVVLVLALSWLAVAHAQGQSEPSDISGAFHFGNYNDLGRAMEGRRQMNAVVERHRVYINMLNTTEDQRNWIRIDFTTNGYPRLRLSRFDFMPANATVNNNDTATGNTTVPGNATSPCDPNNTTVPCNDTVIINSTSPAAPLPATVCDPNSNATIPCSGVNATSNSSAQAFSGFTFRLGLRRIIEFLPSSNSNSSNSNSSACYANETALSQFSFVGSSNSWTPMRVGHTVLFLNNGTVNISDYCTALTKNGATVSICIRVSDVPIFDSSNHSAGPTRVKLSLNLTNYRFVRPNSRLALVGTASSLTAASKSAEQPRLILFSNDGAIDWDGVINTERGPMQVVASELAPLSTVVKGEVNDREGDDDDPLRFTEVSSGVVFCVNNATHASRYSWDPSAEINDQNSPSNNA